MARRNFFQYSTLRIAIDGAGAKGDMLNKRGEQPQAVERAVVSPQGFQLVRLVALSHWLVQTGMMGP
jgi:hypothetical protein